MLRYLRLLAGCVMLAGLVACGGGSGGGASPGTGGGSTGTGPGSGGGLSATGVTLDRSSALFVAGTNNKSDVTSVVVHATFSGAALVVGYAPGQTPPSWLSVTSSPTGSGSGTVTLTSNTQSGYAAGNYTASLRFAAVAADQSVLGYVDLPVTLSVVPSAQPATLDTASTAGGAAVQRTLSVVTSSNVNWTVKTSAPWITTDRTAGTGNGNIVVSLSPAALATGDYSGTVTIEDSTTHAAQVVTVRLGADPKRLLVRRPAVALSLVGSQSRLDGTIVVADNASSGVQWTATSSQPWLQLAQTGGSTTGTLGVTANAAGLADGMYYATVTLSPKNDPAVTNTVNVRVGLYVNRAATFTPTVTVDARVPSPYPSNPAFALVADPIRPLFYRAIGDGQVDIYNSYTGALTGSIAIPGTSLGKIAMTLDGSRLFVVDQASARIYPVNLDTLAVGTPFGGMRTARINFGIAYTEANGLPVLVTSEAQVLDANTGAVLADAKDPNFVVLGSPKVVAQRDGRAMFLQGDSLGNHSLARYSLGYRNGTLSLRETHVFYESGNGEDLALDATDTRLYTAAASASVGIGTGISTGGFGYATADMTRVGYFPPSTGDSVSIATSPSGRIYLASWFESRVDTFGADFTQVATYNYGILGFTSFNVVALSGDTHRLGIALSDGKAVLQFTEAP